MSIETPITPKSSEDDIVKEIKARGSHKSNPDTYLYNCLLSRVQFTINKRMIKATNEANKKLVKETRNLTIATWILVIATIIINLLILFKK